MNNQLTQQEISQGISNYNTGQGGAQGSFTVPLHRHNGSDSPKVIMADLAYDNRGLLFPMNRGNTQIVIINGDTYTITGSNTPTFQQLRIVFGLNYFTETQESETNTTITTTGPSWFLRLPNNSVLPPTPQVGDICIFGGLLQVCQAPGVWTAK
jgi:hypothetical protein